MNPRVELNLLDGSYVRGQRFNESKQRQILHYYLSGFSKRRVAKESRCSVHAVTDAIERFDFNHSFDEHLPLKASDKCPEYIVIMLLVLVKHYPKAMLVEYRRMLEILFGLLKFELPSESMIWRVFQDCKITRKKLRDYYENRYSPGNAILRQLFIRWRDLVPPSLVYSIDETGIQEGSTYREYGWSPAGCRISDPRDNFHARVRWNVIVCVGYREGVVATYPVNCTLNRYLFNAILNAIVLPNLPPNSFLLLDNCSIHDPNQVQQLCAPFRITPVFLPPYSPDLQPVEKAHGLAKSILKREVGRNLTLPRWQIVQAFMSISPAAMKGFYHKCWEERF